MCSPEQVIRQFVYISLYVLFTMLTGLLVRRHAIYTQCLKTLWILKDLGVVQPGTYILTLVQRREDGQKECT